MFVDPLHRLAPMPDHELSMMFFHDPGEHLLALMVKVSKGYAPSPPA